MQPDRAQAPTTQEIEAIVRVVLQRLRGSDAAHTVSSLDTPSPNTLRLHRKLITLDDLRDHWNTFKYLEVGRQAIITPAVRDELRERGVTLTRSHPSSRDKSDAHSHRLLILTPNKNANLLADSLANLDAQCRTAPSDCHETVKAIADHFLSGGAACLWCSNQPFAAAAAAARSQSLIAVQLERLQDLSRATEQASPNTLILDERNWSTASVANLARLWSRSSAA